MPRGRRKQTLSCCKPATPLKGCPWLLGSSVAIQTDPRADAPVGGSIQEAHGSPGTLPCVTHKRQLSELPSGLGVRVGGVSSVTPTWAHALGQRWGQQVARQSLPLRIIVGTRGQSLGVQGTIDIAGKCHLPSTAVLSFPASRAGRQAGVTDGGISQFISRRPRAVSPPFLPPCSCLFELEIS